MRGATRARSDSTASSTCGNTIKPTSQMAAGASSRMSANRAREADGMETALTMTAARAEAHRALRVECERNRLVDGEVGEASGLWQRDPHLGARSLLVHENRRIRTVEEQARHAGRE